MKHMIGGLICAIVGGLAAKAGLPWYTALTLIVIVAVLAHSLRYMR